jgi:hypothetical protein
MFQLKLLPSLCWGKFLYMYVRALWNYYRKGSCCQVPGLCDVSQQIEQVDFMFSLRDNVESKTCLFQSKVDILL